MENKSLTVQFQMAQPSDLSADDLELVSAAKEMTMHSYAPYSRFHVGAALRLKNGIVVKGCNQENAVYPLGLCAERVTIFSSQAQYPDTPIMSLAIAARNTSGEFVKTPCSPCGSCRQVILEHEVKYKQNIRVLLVGEEGIMIFNTVKDLLPFSFSEESLGS